MSGLFKPPPAGSSSMLFNPYLQFGLGILGGNVGATGDEAFASAMRGGLASGFEAQRLGMLGQMQSLQQKQMEQQIAEQERQAELRRRRQAMMPGLAGGMLSAAPETQAQAMQGLLELYPDMAPQILLEQQKAAMKGPNLTTLQRNLEAAGYIPGTPEYQSAVEQYLSKPATSVSIDTGAKLPSGYMWRDPEDKAKGARPIPGGPVEKEQRKEEYRLGAAQTALDRYRQVLKEVGPRWAMGEAKAKLQTAYTDTMIEMKELFNLGVLQGPDMAIMENALRDPTTISAQILEQIGGIEAFLSQLDLVQQKLTDAKKRAAWLSQGAPPEDMPMPTTTPSGWTIRRIK